MLMLICKSKGKFSKKLTIPKQCQEAVQEYITNNDSVAEFIDEKYQIIDSKHQDYKLNCLIKKTDLYNEFKQWGGFNGMKKKQFIYNLVLINPSIKEKRTSNGRCIQGLIEKNEIEFIEDELE